MDPISKKTETRDSRSEGRLGRRIVAVLFSFVEIVFAFRLVFKLFGASGSNGFVKALYAVTQPFVGLFEGIFPKASTSGSVLEPATLIALVVVGLIALGVLKIMGGSTQQTERTQVTRNDVPQAVPPTQPQNIQVNQPQTTQPQAAQPVATQPQSAPTTATTDGNEPK